MFRAAVPEAAVDEDSDPGPQQRDVGGAAARDAVLDAIADAETS
jgi:hypothetical protein